MRSSVLKLWCKVHIVTWQIALLLLKVIALQADEQLALRVAAAIENTAALVFPGLTHIRPTLHPGTAVADKRRPQTCDHIEGVSADKSQTQASSHGARDDAGANA